MTQSPRERALEAALTLAIHGLDNDGQASACAALNTKARTALALPSPPSAPAKTPDERTVFGYTSRGHGYAEYRADMDERGLPGAMSRAQWDEAEERIGSPPDDAPALGEHTPGPWETSSCTGVEPNGVAWDVCGPDGGDMIADLMCCDNAEANARLIAAAPDMLAALKWCQARLFVHEGNSDAYEAAGAAIARATGKEG